MDGTHPAVVPLVQLDDRLASRVDLALGFLLEILLLGLTAVRIDVWSLGGGLGRRGLRWRRSIGLLGTDALATFSKKINVEDALD